MSKSNKHQKQDASFVKKTPNQANRVESAAVVETETPGRFNYLLYPFLLFIFSFFIYKNTFEHRFVLDDHGIIKNNKITKAPMSWENTKTIFSTPLRKGDFSDLENSLYRPFTKLVFNWEWNQFNGDPHSFHKVNVFFFALTVLFIFFIFYDVFKKKWLIPFLIAALFAAHPIHTEVVANVKSLDEILSMLGILIAIRCIQLYISKEKIIYVILAIAGYLIGSFSKESTVVAVAIIPLFIYFFTKASIQKNAIISGVIFVCSLFFLFARHQTLSGYPPAGKTSPLDNYIVLCNPAEQKFLPLDLQEKYKNSNQFASAVNTLGEYVKKFVYPKTLSCDYSYSTLEPVGFNDPGFLVAFLFFVALFGFALWKLKSKQAIAFGILWFFVSMSITSNVFMLIGTSFGDRLLFVPSLGLTIVVVLALAHFFKKEEGEGFFGEIKTAPVMVAILLISTALYSFKTIDRNKDWETDYQLFSTDVENYPNSTHLLFYMGNHLSSTERKEVLTYKMAPLGYTSQQINDSSLKENARSIYYLSKALSIYPALPSDGYNQLGKAYFNLGNLDSAKVFYKKAYNEDSTNAIFINNLGTGFYVSGQNFVKKGREYQAVGKMDSAQYAYNLGLQNILESNKYFMKAYSKDTTEADFANNVGCVYGDTQRPDSAIYWFAKANKADSLDMTSLQYLDMTYRNKGDVQMADYYKAKLEQVKYIRAQTMNQ